MTEPTSGIEAYRARFQEMLFSRLPEHLERARWDEARLAAFQRERLRIQLRNALERSPFHARRLAGIDPDRFELEHLGELPVMTKSEMMEEFDGVLTDRRLSHDLVERTLADTHDAPRPMFGEFLCQASGGSSGRRGIFVLDSEAMADFSAVMLRATIALGTGGQTVAVVAAPSAVHATGIPMTLMSGGPMRLHSAPASLPIGELVARLNAIQPDLLVGYPSMLARLAAERDAGRLTIAPALVRTTSETLLPEHREAIRRAFGAPVMDTFGSSEGLVGASEPDDSTIVFASDLCIVEPVDEQDRPVAPGVPSARVLITNLHNLAQPLIRYALDDCFEVQPPAAGHGHLRALVRGRADEVLHYDHVDVHPITVRSVLVKTPEVIDYQVRQTERGLDATLVAEGTLDVERLSERLRVALGEAGLNDPDVHIEIAGTLARNAGTGKLRRFIPMAAAQ